MSLWNRQLGDNDEPYITLAHFYFNSNSVCCLINVISICLHKILCERAENVMQIEFCLDIESTIKSNQRVETVVLVGTARGKVIIVIVIVIVVYEATGFSTRTCQTQQEVELLVALRNVLRQYRDL